METLHREIIVQSETDIVTPHRHIKVLSEVEDITPHHAILVQSETDIITPLLAILAQSLMEGVIAHRDYIVLSEMEEKTHLHLSMGWL